MPFSVILTEKGGATQRLDFDSEEITIGRVDENDICLPKGNISKKHTKIVVKDGKIIVLDLKSTNGTYVNGKKLAGPQVIQPSDTVYIGDFILNVEPPDLGEPADFADRGAEQPPDSAEEDAPTYLGEEATHRGAERPAPPGGGLDADLGAGEAADVPGRGHHAFAPVGVRRSVVEAARARACRPPRARRRSSRGRPGSRPDAEPGARSPDRGDGPAPPRPRRPR